MKVRQSGPASAAAFFLIFIGSFTTGTSSAWATQKTIKSKVHNYPNAPVVIKQSQVRLSETYTNPSQTTATGSAGTAQSRVRYANRAGLDPSTFVLSGEVLCVNNSSQPVEALALTVVALDAFHQPVQLPGQRDAYAVQQIVVSIPRGTSKSVSWEKSAGQLNIYEAAVIVTRVRFADGSAWVAPGEELIDIF